MPFYDYQCVSCGATWDKLQSITVKPDVTCPSCNSPTAKRLVGTGTSFKLKGGGWEKDGYASAGKK